MPIVFEDSGFVFWEDAWGTASLGIQSGKVAECLTELRRRSLNGVFGRPPYFQESTLDFLSEVPDLTAIAFYDASLRDVSGLYVQRRLEYLGLTGKVSPLEFDRLRTLRGLVWEYHKSATGIDCLTRLEKLNLWRFRAPDKSNFRLKLPESLSSLGLFWSNVETLEGFGRLSNLTRLEVSRCRNLRHLGPLAESFPSLQDLSVSASGRVTAEESRAAIAGHPSLRRVFAGNELLLDVARPDS